MKLSLRVIEGGEITPVSEQFVSIDLSQNGQRLLLSRQSVRLLLYLQLAVLDVLAISAGFVLGGYIGGSNWASPNGISLTFLVGPTYLFLAANQNAFCLTALRSMKHSIQRSLSALAVTAAFIILAGFFMYTRPVSARFAIAASIILATVLLFLVRYTFHKIVSTRFAAQLFNELIIVDDVSLRQKTGHRVIDARQAMIQPDLQDPTMISRLASYLHGVDRVIVACPPERQQAWSLLLKGSNIRGELLLQRSEPLGAIGLNRLGNSETLVVSHGPLSLRARAQKRALDLAITVPLLIFISPLLLVIAIAIKLESPGPVFFKQSRIGRSNSIFSIMKFRSMRTELCDFAGNRSASRDDNRITKVGAILRSTSMDELPQLINVLRGDMSLVGPRPHALGSLAGNKLFWEVDEQYWIRHALKPGITGLAQIRGYRGATLQSEDLENRLRSDLEYVNNWSLWLDVAILFATAKVVKHQNAY